MVVSRPVNRRFTTFVGVDLGGARGKTTAVAQVRLGDDGKASVHAVSTRHRGEPWVDETLLGFVEELGDDVVVAIDAPLTSPACGRCTLPVCPGVEACVDPAVVWLRTEGRALTEDAAVAGNVVGGVPITRAPVRSRLRIQPYAHRCTELVVCYDRGLLPPSSVGASVGLVAHRGAHLRRRLVRAGFALHQNLIEVSPAATIAALFDRRRARGYKRDADPWETRAEIIEALPDLEFARGSRMAREDVLRNDHCFDAVIDAYTAYLWARDGWTMPEAGAPFSDDGWIWTPPVTPRGPR
jgi:predicted nuclease with RNAse H fold